MSRMREEECDKGAAEDLWVVRGGGARAQSAPHPSQPMDLRLKKREE